MPLAGGTFTGAVVGTSFSAPSGFINGSNGGIRIHLSGTKFFNVTAANSARDGVMDIGASDARFKDLYLSGNITAGGDVQIDTSLSIGKAGGASGIGNLTLFSRYSVAAPYISFKTDHPSQSTVWETGRIDSTDSGNFNGKMLFKVATGSGSASGGASMGTVLTLDDDSSATFAGTIAASGGNSTQWNTAYGWGDHASAGYLTSFDITTQTDPKYLRSNANDTLSAVITLDDSGYFVGSPSYGFRFNNSGDTINALIVDNSGNSIAYASHRAPIFYDSNDTNYYVNPGVTSSNSTSHSARFRQSVWIGDSSVYNQNDGGWGARLIVSDNVHSRIDVAQDANSVRASWSTHTGQLYSSFGTVTGHDMRLMSHNATRQLLYNGYSQESGSYRAPIFYDSNDTNYYVDPASTSNLNTVQASSFNFANGFTMTAGGSNYAQVNSWIYLTNNTGIYAPANSAHIYPNQNSDYGSWRVDGARNGWNGFMFATGSVFNTIMSNASAFGLYNDTDNEWYIEAQRNSYLRLYYNGVEQARADNGFFLANNQLRSPIFYDSNNTTYFLNPSASGGNALNTIGDWRQTSDSWSGEVGGKMQYHSNHWYLQATGYIHFRNASGTNTFYVDSGGTGYINNYLTGANSLRAPIFYDSNDTNYYADPNGTSRLYHAQTPNGSEFIHCKHSGSDFANGTLVTTDIPANTTSGASYVIEVTGKSYSGEPPFAFKAQGYLYNNTIINHSGVSYGKHLGGNNQIKVFNHSDNKLAFWWPRVSYWNSFEVRVRDSGGSARNRALSIDNSTEPSSSKKVTTTLSQAALLGHNYGSGSLYSDRMYDQNDTSFYVDPNSTSYLSKIWTRGSTTGNAAPRWDTSFHVAQSQHFYGHNSTQTLYFGESNPAIFGSTLTVAGDILVNGGHGGINLSNSSIVSSRTSSWTGNPGTEGKIQYHSARWYIVSDSASDRIVQFRRDGSDKSYIDNDGRLLNQADARGYVFYDQDDTNYYFDPNSTSLSGKLRSYLLFNDYGAGIIGSYSSYRYQLVFAMGNSYKGALDGTSVSGGYGLWYSHPNAGGVAANLSDHGLMNIVSGTWNASLASSTRASSDMRAPIFYDLNNTGYYVNPDSTSRLLNLDFGVAGYYLKAGDWGTRQQTPYGWIQFGPANTSHAHIYTDRSNFYFNKQIQLLGGTLINQNDIQAARFYDRSDTAYYCDPNSTSNMNAITLVGTLSGQNAYFNQDVGIGFTSGNIGGNLNVKNSAAGQIAAKLELGSSVNSASTGVFVNTTASYASSGMFLHFQSNHISGDDNVLICYLDGDIVNKNNSYTQYSDERLKENIVDATSKLDEIKQIRVRNFNFIGDDLKQIGVVAQELEPIFPALVKEREVPGQEDPIKTVKYSVLVPILIKAMQEQQTIIDDLKSRLETLENN